MSLSMSLRKWLFLHGVGRPEAILLINPTLLRLTEDIFRPIVPELDQEHKAWMIENNVIWRFETIRKSGSGYKHFPSRFKRKWKETDDYAVAFYRKDDAALFMLYYPAKKTI